MSAKFTPGPWIAETNGLSVHLVTPEGLTGSAVCMLMTKSGAIYNHEANARLIAAAPAMYEALATMLEVWPNTDKKPGWVDRWIDAQAKARATLALARGEA